MENTGENRRTKMTKTMMKNGLVDLMKTKSIRNITIKEICEAADVNRSTFYRHYNTQYELYDDIFNDITNDIAEIIDESNAHEAKTNRLLTDILKYVEANRDIILVVLSDNGNLNIGQSFTELVNNIIMKKATSGKPATELELYVIHFISAGMANLVWTWLNTENRQSAREVAGVVNMLVMNGLQRAISLAGNSNK